MLGRLAAGTVLFLSVGQPLKAQAPSDRSIILVTLDGIRPTDFFGGLDSLVSADPDSSGIYDMLRVQRDYWRPTPEERRRALMPFLWDTLIPRGVAYGNVARGSRVTITNPYGFSAPGYMEILTGRAQPDVTSNDAIRYGHQTVLEYVRRRLNLRARDVAVFGSWDNFRFYAASQPDAVFVNAGYDSLPSGIGTAEMRLLAHLQFRALAIWEGSRLDAFTGGMALAYLKQYQPRLTYIAFNDTDDFAHLRRYDRVLDAMHALDQFLGELWYTVQTLPAYRGRTTLIVTTDHGRGLTKSDWVDHGEGVPGSESIWMVLAGAGVAPLGEATNRPEVHQANVAATVLACLGLDVTEFSVDAGPAVKGSCTR
jgi:hypothetical protein